MYKAIRARIEQGYRTVGFPAEEPVFPERFRGLPLLDSTKCSGACGRCLKSCSTGAMSLKEKRICIDLGKCLFCLDCVQACPQQAITFSKEYRLCARTKENLILSGAALPRMEALGEKIRRVFGRSLKLRQVSAGGCNGCEADTNVLSTIVFDLGRFGIQFVASPRHADGLLITGPVTGNMRLALEKTYEAVPSPKIVIAAGACAISGGPYIHHPEQLNGADSILPVDLYIPGCPPHPYTILDGVLRLLGRI